MTGRGDMLEAVRALAPRIRAASPQIEASRRLPEELFRALAVAGVFKAYLPPSLGGRGASLGQLAPVIEEIARSDGSAGWLAYVGSEAVRQTLRLDQSVAARVTQSPYAFIAGMFTPGRSRAVAVPGGYRVSGQWHTCSGSLHADWMIGGATVYDGAEPRRGADGTPLVRLNFIPMSLVTVVDTWFVGGLRGTNSNDLRVDDVFVPEEYGADNVEPPDIGLHLMVPLGIARAAMQEFVALARVRGPTKAGGALYRELPAVQREVAAAEASLRAARCYALATLAEVDARAEATKPARARPTTPAHAEPTEPARAEATKHAGAEATTLAERDAFFLAAHHVGQVAVSVVDTLHAAAGTAGIFASSHLLRCFLDVHVAVSHVSLQPINLEPAARRLMA